MIIIYLFEHSFLLNPDINLIKMYEMKKKTYWKR